MRGKIRNKEFASQIKDFSGLRYGKITPTDIDAALEFSNKIYIFIESKFQSSMLPLGQKLCLTRMVDSVQSKNKHALLIICDHECNPGEEIDIAHCKVREWYCFGSWKKPYKYLPKNVKDVIDSFLLKYMGMVPQ